MTNKVQLACACSEN